MTILIVAEHDNASLKPATRNAVAAATLIDGEVHVLVAGSCCTAVAEAASKMAGVRKVLLADAIHYADQLAENIAALIVAIAADYSHIVAPATTSGKGFMPRVAALLDVAQISDVVAVESADTFTRPTYAGNVLTTIRSIDAIKVFTVRATAFDPVAAGGNAIVETIDPGPCTYTTKLLQRTQMYSARPELTAAHVVVSGGRGLGSRENYHALLEPLADALGAALGASRAAVDAGFVSNDYQVGQSGKIVAPQLYFAIGISGAVQHVAGMKGSKVIVAINKDPEAPIFEIADYGLVADLFEAIPALVKALGAH